MAKRGLGDRQVSDYKTATQKILKVLNDGKTHRYLELQEKTGLSTATLTRHLKELEQGIVERILDTESGEYPPPVYYRLRSDSITSPLGKLDQAWKYVVIEHLKKWFPLMEKDKKTAAFALYSYVNFLDEHAGLSLLNALRCYLDDKNEKAFNQYLEFYILSFYREGAVLLKENLEKLASEGVDAFQLIREAEQQILKQSKKRMK